MADINPLDSFDSQPENDFEKISASGNGFDQEDDGLLGAGADSNEPQDGEVTTTTSNVAGEDEAEEDRYNAIGASEAEAFVSSPDPLISFEEDPQLESFLREQVQPSAPVPESEPEINEPLIDFGNSYDPDISSSFAPSAPPSSRHYPESEPIPTASNPHQFVNDSETESKHVSEQRSESEDTSKGTWLKGVDPRESESFEEVNGSSPQILVDLIYWRDVKKTGIVFGAMLVVLLSLAIFSLVSVLAYLSLALLTVTFSFVVYKKVVGAVQKSTEGHPFKQLLEMDMSLNEEKLKSVIQNLLKNINKTINELRRLFLIEDLVDSIKFGLMLWVMTYVGCLLNGMSLIILAVVLLFTVPKVYETYQVQIDNYLGLAKAQINNILSIIQSKLPFLKKKEKAQ